MLRALHRSVMRVLTIGVWALDAVKATARRLIPYSEDRRTGSWAPKVSNLSDATTSNVPFCLIAPIPTATILAHQTLLSRTGNFVIGR
jgi:hypothetical protein